MRLSSHSSHLLVIGGDGHDRAGRVKKYCRQALLATNTFAESVRSPSKREHVFTSPQYSISPEDRATTFCVVKDDATRCCPWNSMEQLGGQRVRKQPAQSVSLYLRSVVGALCRGNDPMKDPEPSRNRHTRLSANSLGFATSRKSSFAAYCSSGRFLCNESLAHRHAQV